MIIMDDGDVMILLLLRLLLVESVVVVAVTQEISKRESDWVVSEQVKPK